MKNFFYHTVLAVILLATVLSFNSCDKIDDALNDDNNDSTQTTTLGDTLWVHNLSFGENELWITDAPLAIGTDGTIYYSAGGGMSNWEAVRIYAVDKTNGSLKWKTEPLHQWKVNSNIVIGDDGTIYVESYTKLYSISPGDGSFNWIWEVPETINVNGQDLYTYGELGPMALANNGDLIVKTTGSGSYYRARYCISPSGTMKWYRFIGAENTPISIGYDGVIYDFAHDDTHTFLSASDPDSGEILWTLPVYNLVSAGINITIAENGDIITQISSDTLVRINPDNQTFIWKVAAAASEQSKIIGTEGYLYLFDQWAGMYRYDIATGNMVGDPMAIPHYSIIDSKGQLYGIMSDNNPYLTVTDNSGNIVWENKTDTYLGHPTTLSNEKVVYTANSKKVFAIQTDAGLSQSQWPCFTHDNRNTFNYNKH